LEERRSGGGKDSKTIIELPLAKTRRVPGHKETTRLRLPGGLPYLIFGPERVGGIRPVKGNVLGKTEWRPKLKRGPKILRVLEGRGRCDLLGLREKRVRGRLYTQNSRGVRWAIKPRLTISTDKSQVLEKRQKLERTAAPGVRAKGERGAVEPKSGLTVSGGKIRGQSENKGQSKKRD